MRDTPVVWVVADILSYVRFKLPLLFAFDCCVVPIVLDVELQPDFKNAAGAA